MTAINKDFIVKHGLVVNENVTVAGSVTVNNLVTNTITATTIINPDGPPITGDYNDLINKPVLFSGSYNDLTDLPAPVDLTGYATETYVSNAISEIPIVDLTGYATESYVTTAVSNLVNAAPATLDTLNELATALGNDSNFATTVSTNISTKWTQDNTKISHWDTAYSWGNHTSAGYLTPTYASIVNITNTTSAIQNSVGGALKVAGSSYLGYGSDNAYATFFGRGLSAGMPYVAANWNGSNNTAADGYLTAWYFRAQSVLYTPGATLNNTNNTFLTPVVVTDTTVSTSKTTGALKVTGGAGISGDVYATSFHGDGSALTNLPQQDLSSYALTSTVNTLLSTKADTSYVDNGLSLKANQSTTYTKTEVDTSLATKANLTDLTPTNISDKSNTSTGYFDLPSGTTAQRPSSANTGNFRYNSDSGGPEYYNGTTWMGLGALDGSTENRAAPSALYLKNTAGLTTSGVYWIKTANMTQAVQVYCDLSYDNGGYMLLAYGYVASTNDSSSNKAIPNLNHDGTAWSYTPTSRASANGLVLSPSSQKSALLLAKSSTTMIMAAGGNPSSGGIDGYSYVYRFPIPDPAALTFNNHSYYYNSSMTNTSGFTVTGLKGDIGTWTRYTIKEAIGASWSDSYPTGYGCIENSSPKNTTWDYGPFFPSIHSGSRNVAPGNPTVVSSSPDIGVNGYTAGAQSYTYRGWYGAGIGVNQTGQTSIWVK